MDCQNIEDHIFDFLTNRISLDQSDELNNHLRKCSNCRKRVAESKSLLTNLNVIKPAILPKDFSQQVLAGINAREKADSAEKGIPKNIIQTLTRLFSKSFYPAPAIVTALVVIGLASLFYQQQPGLSPEQPTLKQNEIRIPSSIHINVADIDLGLQKISSAVKNAKGIIEYQETLGPDTWRLDIQISPQFQNVLVNSLKNQGLILNEEVVFENNNTMTIILSVGKK